MRNWRVWIETHDGKQYMTRALNISKQHAVLRGEQVLPGGMHCNLHIVIPALHEKQGPTVAAMQAEVGQAVFTSAGIRLDFKVTSLSLEARQLIEGVEIQSNSTPRRNCPN